MKMKTHFAHCPLSSFGCSNSKYAHDQQYIYHIHTHLVSFVELWKSYTKNEINAHFTYALTHSLTYIYCCLKVKPSMGDAHSYSFTHIHIHTWILYFKCCMNAIHMCVVYVDRARLLTHSQTTFYQKIKMCTVLLMCSDATNYSHTSFSPSHSHSFSVSHIFLHRFFYPGV